MRRGFEIVRYRPEHKQSVAELQTALWSADAALNARYFEWKYEHNPWAVEPRIYLALRDGSAVGMRGFYESRWEGGTPSRIVSIPLSDDLAIRSEARNSGLVTQITRTALADLAASGFEYVFSLSAGRVTLLSSLALGWKSAGKLEPLARRQPGARGRSGLRERFARTRLVWRWAGSPMLRSRDERQPFRRLDAAGRGGSGMVIAREPRPEAMADLVARLGHDGRLRHVRDRAYLAWCFQNPMHEYRFLYAGSDRLDGYLVLRARVMSLSPSARVCIADLEARDVRVREELLAAAVEVGRFLELVTWAVSHGPQERAALRRLGFEALDPALSARGFPSVLVRSVRERADEPWAIERRPLLDPGNWDLRMLYTG
jgi:hypothetical protein